MALDTPSLAARAEDTSAILPNLIDICAEALDGAEALLTEARSVLRDKVTAKDRVSGKMLEAHQQATHGLAWTATYVEALRQMLSWARRQEADGKLGELEQLLLQVAFGEYLAQLRGGIPMSQGEMVRPQDLGLSFDQARVLVNDATEKLVVDGPSDGAKARIVALMIERAGAATYGDCGLDDDFEMIREQFWRFSQDRVLPDAHEWHLKDELIPMEIVQEMAELGVFGLTIPEEFGGAGLGKTAMCVVSEELSRGYIGVGSLGTRSEIAAELILCGGSDEQKAEFLPKLASAEILPTAVFTEPNTGSDLGALRTRGERDGDDYVITGNKTWITHAARADMMTLLVRTDPNTTDWRGLSMFLAPKARGTEETDFPDEGISGGEIEVLGYRGMKEYELGFDGYRVPAKNLLGETEGMGFKHLMQTFESARIQTAARAVGVAQSALDISLQYAQERQQFGKSLVNFPRVYSKIAMMAVEIMVARQLTYFSAREKDADRRCDLEAGMAKLLGARIAWAAADNGLQIHGGNGFALEYPISRVLCDARILNIFEGAAEIQAQVIARRVLETGN
ncbi:MAG: acyl-CoA dehydrogenase family protein [Pseudomonadota bacterium]